MSLLWGTGKRLCCCVVAAIACSGTNTTLAEDSPGAVSLQFGDATYNWLVGEDGTTNYHDTGYEFTGSDFNSGWAMSWNMMASGSALAESLVTNFVVTNTSSTTQTFTLYQSMAVSSPLSTSLIGGSVSGAVSDFNGNGATVGAVSPSDSIYFAFVDATDVDPFDGTVVGNLLTGASATSGSFLTGTFDSEAFGDFPTLPSDPGPAINTNMGIGLEFTLSAGDSAAFTASFVASIPGPGPMALAGVAGFLHRGRRRRS